MQEEGSGAVMLIRNPGSEHPIITKAHDCLIE